MRITHIVATAATAALASTGIMAVAGPASADVTYTTAATLETLDEVPVAYGDDITFSGGITDNLGNSDVYGPATLMVLSTKNPVWTAVQTDETGGNYYFWDVKPESNSIYKVVYGGYTTTNSLSGEVMTWTPSESAPVEVTVKRTVDVKIKRLTIKGKVKPKYAKKKVVIKKIVGKKLKRYAKVKTNKKSVFTFRAPNKPGFKFAVVIPGDKHYTGWANPYHVYRPNLSARPSLRLTR